MLRMETYLERMERILGLLLPSGSAVEPSASTLEDVPQENTPKSNGLDNGSPDNAASQAVEPQSHDDDLDSYASDSTPSSS